MKKIALLTSKNLEGYVVDEDCFVEEFKSSNEAKVEYRVWNDPAVNWSEYDLVVIRTTWDYAYQPTEFLKTLKKIESSCATLLNESKVVEWNIEKSYLKKLEQKGVSVIKSLFFLEEVEDFHEKLNEWGCEKFVLKPVVGAGSDKIKVFNIHELLEWFQKSKKENLSKYFVQPFLSEVFDGETSYFFFNGEFKYAVKKTPKSGEFRVQEEFGGLIQQHTPHSEELEHAKKVLSALPFEKAPLYARVDALSTQNSKTWKLMELELIEPSMFFRVVQNSVKLFKESLLSHSF